jgi:hypothetical protein
MSALITLADLERFTGDLERYRHALQRDVLYTPGVQYLAERGGAYWLIDAIASYFGSAVMKKALARDERLVWLQFWRLEVKEDRSAVLGMQADKGEPPAIQQKILYTDFPLEQVEIWAGFDGRYWTLYLPSEH